MKYLQSCCQWSQTPRGNQGSHDPVSLPLCNPHQRWHARSSVSRQLMSSSYPEAAAVSHYITLSYIIASEIHDICHLSDLQIIHQHPNCYLRLIAQGLNFGGFISVFCAPGLWRPARPLCPGSYSPRGAWELGFRVARARPILYWYFQNWNYSRTWVSSVHMVGNIITLLTIPLVF